MPRRKISQTQILEYLVVDFTDSQSPACIGRHHKGKISLTI